MSTLVLIILPWTIRNCVLHQTFVPASTNGGFAFFMGNNEDSNGGVGDINQLFRDMPEVEQEKWRALSETERNRQLWQMGIEFWRKNPQQAIRLTLDRVGYFLWFRPYLLKAQFPRPFAIGYMASYALLLAFFSAGLFLIRGKVQAWFIPLIVLFAVFMTTIPFAISIRYRAIIEPLMIMVAAVPVAGLAARFTRRR